MNHLLHTRMMLNLNDLPCLPLPPMYFNTPTSISLRQSVDLEHASPFRNEVRE